MELPRPQESTQESENEAQLVEVKNKIIPWLLENNRFVLPPRYKNKNLANFNGMPEKVELALNAIKTEKSVFLCGSVGSGKTHLACGLMYEWYKHHICLKESEFNGSIGISYPKDPVFLYGPNLFLELKSVFSKNDGSEESIVSKYSTPPLLVLDDMGAEKISDWTRSGLIALIGRRHMYCRQTIITSNLSLDEISKIDDRISSRFLEMGVVIDMGDKDYRLTINANALIEGKEFRIIAG